jgi:hypothetical protein
MADRMRDEATSSPANQNAPVGTILGTIPLGVVAAGAAAGSGVAAVSIDAAIPAPVAAPPATRSAAAVVIIGGDVTAGAGTSEVIEIGACAIEIAADAVESCSPTEAVDTSDTGRATKARAWTGEARSATKTRTSEMRDATEMGKTS